MERGGGEVGLRSEVRGCVGLLVCRFYVRYFGVWFFFFSGIEFYVDVKLGGFWVGILVIRGWGGYVED